MNQKIRDKLHEIIFEADTAAGKTFDVALIWSILFSVLVVILDSVGMLHLRFGSLFYYLEWFFTVLFTIEYILRLHCTGRSLSYALSFFGIVDLLAILPTYISIVIPGSHFLIAVRILRVLRVFRVLKLVQYSGEAEHLLRSLKASQRKITVFLFGVLTLVILIGSVMYVIEGEGNGFTSIPVSIYWAVVTLTTVGYGDISPQTSLGQVLASIVMILGYGIIAVPTGIVTAEMSRMGKQPPTTQVCRYCVREGHDSDATHCKYCGTKL